MAKSKVTKDSLESLAEDLMLSSSNFQYFARVWDSLTTEQKTAVRRLVGRANRFMHDLCNAWDVHDIPFPE